MFSASTVVREDTPSDCAHTHFAMGEGAAKGACMPSRTSMITEEEQQVRMPPITLNAATVRSGVWEAPTNTVRNNSAPTRKPFTIQDFLHANQFNELEEDEQDMPSYAFYETVAEDLHAVQQHTKPPALPKSPKAVRPKQAKRASFRPMLDSGAGEFVCSSRHAPGIPVTPSVGSMRGQTFGTAGKDVLKNQGQQRFTLNTSSGERLDTTWQTADVSRPLMGVGRVCDTGNRGAFFTKDGAVILDRVTTSAIQDYIREHGGSLCRFEREGGVYVLEAEINEEDGKGQNEQAFVRPGQ